MEQARKRDEARGVPEQQDLDQVRLAGLQRYLPADIAKQFQAKLSGKYTPKLMDNTHKLKKDNKGHQLLKKLGWNEGQTLGQAGRGILNPVKAGGRRMAGAGLGSEAGAYAPGNVSKKDDPFTAYKKRMALAYQYRPNPLNNPRKKYWEDPNMNQGATMRQ